MKILKITFVAVISSFLMILPSNSIEKRIGIAAGFTSVSADGTETLKDSAAKHTTEAEENTIIPSLFAELAMDNGLGIGLDYIVGSADLAGSNQQSIGNTDSNRAEDTGTNTANAEVSSIHTLYLTKMFDSGLFLKLGMSSADVKTKETLASGTTYGNKSVDGTMIGIGWGRTMDTGLFFRAAVEYTDFDEITLTSGVADAVSDTTNTIKADVDVTMAKFSIGKAF